MYPIFTTIILGSLSLLTHAFPANTGSLDVTAPLSKRYASGSCGVHVVQYQKNEGPGGDTSVYRLDVLVKDAYKNGIGEVNTVPSPAIIDGSNSELPSSLTITAGNVDTDSVSYAYEGQSWLSDGSTCSQGDYDDGSRQIDCRFTC